MTQFLESGDRVRFDVQRKLDTGDPNDYVFQYDKETMFGWVANTVSANEQRKHNKSGVFVSTFEEPESLASLWITQTVPAEQTE